MNEFISFRFLVDKLSDFDETGGLQDGVNLQSPCIRWTYI